MNTNMVKTYPLSLVDQKPNTWAYTYKSFVKYGFVHYPVVVSIIITETVSKAKTVETRKGEPLFSLQFTVQYLGSSDRLASMIDRYVYKTYRFYKVAASDAFVLASSYPEIEAENEPRF